MLSTLFFVSLLLGADPAIDRKPFAITVVDEQSGRGVPLVELRTVHGICLWSDSKGIVAFDEPGLMGKDVFFHVRSHGYEFPPDRFGMQGKALRVVPGGQAKLLIRRINLAERLYRITGAGIYRDTVLVGQNPPLKEPLLNGLVLGSDSVLNAVYRGKLYWFWGDTNRPGYPLGNFDVPGAISALPGQGGLDTETGIDLDYFLGPSGFAKATAKMPGLGPTWMTTLVPLIDAEGKEKLYASFVKVEPPLRIYGRVLAVFNDEKNEFEKLTDVDLQAPGFPSGHSFRHTEEGVEYVYFAHPYPLTRVPATVEDFLKPDRYECYTCLKEGSTLKAPQLDRDAKGQLRYAWRKKTPSVGPAEQAKLIAAKTMQREEGLLQLRDRDSGASVLAHAGSVYWNAHRKRWVLITVQSGGSSYLGEIWYAEADTPVGPWVYAVKVATHDRYSFYNPKQHPMFDKEDGRVIFFEGTYTHTFSGNLIPTPRYDYNQILYRLELSNPRVALPLPVYDLSEGEVPERFVMARAGKPPVRVAFFALDRPLPGAVQVRMGKEGITLGAKDGGDATFFALPAETKSPPATTTPLYEYRHGTEKRRAYSIDANLNLPGFERENQPICLVWKLPV